MYVHGDNHSKTVDFLRPFASAGTDFAAIIARWGAVFILEES